MAETSGVVLHTARDATGFSQAQLAEAADLDSTYPPAPGARSAPADFVRDLAVGSSGRYGAWLARFGHSVGVKPAALFEMTPIGPERVLRL